MPMKLIIDALLYLFLITNFPSVLAQTTRTHLFRVQKSDLKLADTLPSHTQICSTWPEGRLRTNLPDLISAAVVVTNDNETKATLVGPPIHVVVGGNLNVTLQNEISSGISLHFHGFSYSNAFEYAGAVGVSQCPLAKGESFVYNIAMNEFPGTYWYHAEAEAAGNLNVYDAVRGALIVHPKGSESLVDRLNASLQYGNNPLAYDNERILFFQDGFVSSPAEKYLQHVGNLLPPASKIDEGFVVATSQWDFGTCNGKLREIITVEPNQKYNFRLINGGQHFALRFSISGGFPLTVVAADSNPIEPYTVDSVVLHVGERFDVEVSTQDLTEGESFWIAADTLESQLQGYQNGVRAIMRVSSNEPMISEDVLDPSPNIKASSTVKKNVKVLNCYHADNCIPITALRSLPTRSTASEAKSGLEFMSAEKQVQKGVASEIHFVETHFQLAPLYAHFVRVDNSYWIQNDFPPAAMISREYRPANSVHPHSVPLEVASNSTVIIVWRTTLLMDHPIHLHGHTVEILDVSHPKRQHCNLAHCELNQDYSTNTLDKIRALDKTTQIDAAVKKDTFIIPAGGVVVTRLHTDAQGLWLAHGQMDLHRQDGMSFVLNVGDYQIPKFDEWLPNDFPSCNTSLVKSLKMNPACECFVDKDRPLLVEMPDKYLCSRSHLCHHEFSQAANLHSYRYKKGFSSIQNVTRDWQMPGFIFVLSFGLIVAVILMLLAFLPSIPSIQSKEKEGHTIPWIKRISFLSVTADATTTTRSSIPRRSTIDYSVPHRRSTIDFSVGSIFDGMSYIGTVNDVEESQSDVEETSEHDVDTTRSHSLQRSNNRRRLSSVAASIEGRLDRALGSILIERGDEGDGTDGFSQGFEIMPDGYSVKGKLTFDPCDSDVVNSSSPFSKQAVYIFEQQFRVYFSSCCNLLRLLEVGGVALLTGQLFRQDFEEASEATISDMFSLVLFLSITWTYTRMYSIIPMQHQWFKSIQIVHKNRRFSLPPVLLARISVLLLCECLWPAAFCVICYPVMGLTGDWITLCKISLLISLNNICYLSLGALCALVNSMPYGMIVATVMSQISILSSGVFAQLPTSIQWLNKRSPFFWTIRGLMKCVLDWSDSFRCVHGSSEIEGGVHQCFIEESLVIDQLKRRGIYDPSSGSGVLEECIALLILASCIHIFICIRCVFSFYRVDWYKLKRIKSRII
mmetsp:Transcript_34111/g.69679  ORF Transcript_34111/g.69679 Transcript_34111/m.69679 type:complete len:1192 (-) Transcript_34111:732-4307(-)